MKDLIIDCFAGGGGASVGIEMALGRPEAAYKLGKEMEAWKIWDAEWEDVG